VTDRRVERLRRLAASTTFPAERKSALAKARELEARAPAPPPMAGVPMYASRQSAQTAYEVIVDELKRAMRETEEAIEVERARGWGVTRTATVSSIFVNGVPVNTAGGGVIFTVRFD
jgi:hypothetical protein